MSDELSEELRELVRSNNVSGIYEYGNRNGKDGIRETYRAVSKYFRGKGDHVMALAYAESCGANDLIDEILSDDNAVSDAWNFVGPEMEMMIRHMTPFAIAGTPQTRMYRLLQAYEARKQGKEPPLW